MTTNIDELMDLDPTNLTRENITDLIQYYRRQKAGGPRPKKETGPTVEIDLAALGIVPSSPVFRRR